MMVNRDILCHYAPGLNILNTVTILALVLITNLKKRLVHFITTCVFDNRFRVIQQNGP
jgi:hypothetical protein